MPRVEDLPPDHGFGCSHEGVGTDCLKVRTGGEFRVSGGWGRELGAGDTFKGMQIVPIDRLDPVLVGDIYLEGGSGR